MKTHLSVRKLDFDKAQNSSNNNQVVTMFKNSIKKVHEQYASDYNKISLKVSKIFTNLFCSQAWDTLSSEQRTEIKHICNLHYKQNVFQAQNWKLLLQTK